VSADPAPERACAPSFLGRPPGELPSPRVGCPLPGRQVHSVAKVSMGWPLTRRPMGTAMVMVPPAPLVSAVVDAVDQASREQHPRHGLAAMPRAWLACGVIAVLVTHAMCWARFARVSLGTYALAALSWMLRPRKLPWDDLWVASVRVLLRHDGLTCGRLVRDDRANTRSTSANTRAHLDKRRDKDRGGDVWGQGLVVLLVVRPDLTLPVGLTGDQPAPALSAWDQQDKARTKPAGPAQQRPPNPPPSVLSHPTRTRAAPVRPMQRATSPLQGARAHGGGPRWHGARWRWRRGAVRWRAGDLAATPPAAQPHPGRGSRGRAGWPCAVVCLLPPHPTVPRGQPI
jgi:hypothetical protein